MTLDEIGQAHPHLDETDIRAALGFAADICVGRRSFGRARDCDVRLVVVNAALAGRHGCACQRMC